MEDLQQMITSLLNQGHDLVLGGDFNESLQDTSSTVLQLATSCRLIDPFPMIYSVQSDHRLIITELQTALLFGHTTTSPLGRGRGLKSNDKVAVTKYIFGPL